MVVQTREEEEVSLCGTFFISWFHRAIAIGGSYSSDGGTISIPVTLPQGAMDGNGLVCLTYTSMHILSWLSILLLLFCSAVQQSRQFRLVSITSATFILNMYVIECRYLSISIETFMAPTPGTLTITALGANGFASPRCVLNDLSNSGSAGGAGGKGALVKGMYQCRIYLSASVQDASMSVIANDKIDILVGGVGSGGSDAGGGTMLVWLLCVVDAL